MDKDDKPVDKKDDKPKPRKKAAAKRRTAKPKREHSTELPHAFGTCVPLGECQCQK